jgi:hypothetical protein
MPTLSFRVDVEIDHARLKPSGPADIGADGTPDYRFMVIRRIMDGLARNIEGITGVAVDDFIVAVDQ